MSQFSNHSCAKTVEYFMNVTMVSTSRLREHPVYLELRLTVSPLQLSAVRALGDLAFRDPLLVTREGVIIDGYSRKAYADCVGISTLPCVEFDMGDEEALRMILGKHRRSLGWNDYNRIRMASRLKHVLRRRAQANQQSGGRFKGSSKLTEAHVRKEIAVAACVSEGNVSKVEQLHNSHPDVLCALAAGEIRIHRAWLWRELPPEQQGEELRRFRLNRGLEQPVKIHALRRGAHRTSRIVLSLAKLRALLQTALSRPSSDQDNSELIEIRLIKAGSKTVFLTTEMYEALWIDGSANRNGDEGCIQGVP